MSLGQTNLGGFRLRDFAAGVDGNEVYGSGSSDSEPSASFEAFCDLHRRPATLLSEVEVATFDTVVLTMPGPLANVDIADADRFVDTFESDAAISLWAYLL